MAPAVPSSFGKTRLTRLPTSLNHNTVKTVFSTQALRPIPIDLILLPIMPTQTPFYLPISHQISITIAIVVQNFRRIACSTRNKALPWPPCRIRLPIHPNLYVTQHTHSPFITITKAPPSSFCKTSLRRLPTLLYDKNHPPERKVCNRLDPFGPSCQDPSTCTLLSSILNQCPTGCTPKKARTNARTHTVISNHT